MENKLVEWKPINGRLLKARFKGRHNNLTVIQCYALTNESKDKIKDAFYDQLQSEIISSSNHDILIVMGDLNAKFGKENTGLERVMGKHGCGCMNNNWQRLVDICSPKYVVTQLRNRFDVLTTETPDNNDVNSIWDDIKSAYEEASKHCLGFKTSNTVKKWLTPTTWDVIEKRRHIKLKELDAKSQRLKEKHKEDYRIADKEVKKN